MTNLEKDMIEYFVACISEFSKKYNMSLADAAIYLYDFGGLDYLEESYDVEHTFSFEDTIEHLTIICSKNGGRIV